VKFYGPVSNNTPGTIPMIVEYDIGSGWVDVSTKYSHTTTGRTVTIQTANDILLEDVPVTMRVRPRSNLVCDPAIITSGSAVGVASFDWQFMP
jgi:hypothetical protein